VIPERAAAACLLCGGERFAPQFPGADAAAAPARPAEPYRITHSERRLVHAIVRCTACGMVTLPQGMAAADYAEAEDPYYLDQAEERIANARDLLALVPPGGRLLEVGCACGFLLVAAREKGFEVRGVEMSVWASDYARRAFGLEVTTGRLETLDLPAAGCDVVVLADVIEHLPDPRDTVRRVRELLRPGGRLLVLTPDIGSAAARLAGRRWWGLLDDHYFYFSRRTLRRLLEEEGYAIERIGAFGRRFPLRHWVFKLSQYSPALHGAADRLTRRLGVGGLRVAINLGDQMVCIARKK
jgi:2-polyprenyl-3-methyl-5-hydroxy-6-metoxy-1,4-benzoquinol methylase